MIKRHLISTFQSCSAVFWYLPVSFLALLSQKYQKLQPFEIWTFFHNLAICFSIHQFLFWFHPIDFDRRHLQSSVGLFGCRDLLWFAWICPSHSPNLPLKKMENNFKFMFGLVRVWPISEPPDHSIRRLKATGTFHEDFGWNENLLSWFTNYLYSRKCTKNAKLKPKLNGLIYFEFW